MPFYTGVKHYLESLTVEELFILLPQKIEINFSVIPGYKNSSNLIETFIPRIQHKVIENVTYFLVSYMNVTRKSKYGYTEYPLKNIIPKKSRYIIKRGCPFINITIKDALITCLLILHEQYLINIKYQFEIKK